MPVARTTGLIRAAGKLGYSIAPAEPVPCTVLGPFSGAGTTGVAALLQGSATSGLRRASGIRRWRSGVWPGRAHAAANEPRGRVRIVQITLQDLEGLGACEPARAEFVRRWGENGGPALRAAGSVDAGLDAMGDALASESAEGAAE